MGADPNRFRKAQLPVHSFVAEHEPSYVEQAFALVLQHPADLVHLSKPRLPGVVFGLLYKLLWGAAVLVDIDDEELCNACEREPITLDGLKRLWIWPSGLTGSRWPTGRCRGAMAARQDSGWLLSQHSVGAACRMSRGQQ